MSRVNHRNGKRDNRNLRRRDYRPTPFQRARHHGRVRASVRCALAHGETPRVSEARGFDGIIHLDRTAVRRGDE